MHLFRYNPKPLTTLLKQSSPATTRTSFRRYHKMSSTPETMHVAQVFTWGSAPTYTSVPKPIPDTQHTLIKVAGVGLHNVVLSRAAGTHYTSGALPHAPGVDGVGHDPTGTPIYFFTFTTGGSYSEWVCTEKRKTVSIPADVDMLQVAAYANPAMSSWMALRTRVVNLPANFTVLIMGATSASGRMAVDVARVLGASKIIAAARSAEALATVGADETIVLQADVTATDFSASKDVDVILDYVYGDVATHLFTSTKFTKPVQYVHIGGLAGTEMTLPGHVLRSMDLTIRGSGPGSFKNEEMAKHIPEMIKAFAKFRQHKIKTVALKDVAEYWGKSQKGERLVFVP